LKRRIHLTSVVVTHDRDLALASPTGIAIMFEGNIVQIGTPAEIRGSKNGGHPKNS